MTQFFDIPLLLWIHQHLRFDFATLFFTTLTKAGDHGIIWIVILALMLVFKKTRKDGALATISFCVVAALCNIFLKNLIARPRPFMVSDAIITLIERPTSLSFPSGHTAVAFAVALVVFARNKIIGIPLLILAILMGYSRMYVGVHYPTDVIVGFLLALAVSTTILLFVRPKRYK